MKATRYFERFPRGRGIFQFIQTCVTTPGSAQDRQALNPESSSAFIGTNNEKMHRLTVTNIVLSNIEWVALPSSDIFGCILLFHINHVSKYMAFMYDYIDI